MTSRSLVLPLALVVRTAHPRRGCERLDLALTETDRRELNLLVKDGRPPRIIVHLHSEVSGA